MKKQSEKLTKFYREFLGWVEGGKSNSYPFDPGYGLCQNLRLWAKAQSCDRKGLSRLRDELHMQFRHAKLCIVYPFNDQDGYAFQNDKTFNKERMAWVISHAKLGE